MTDTHVCSEKLFEKQGIRETAEALEKAIGMDMGIKNQRRKKTKTGQVIKVSIWLTFSQK